MLLPFLSSCCWCRGRSSGPFAPFIKSLPSGKEILLFERGNRASHKISRLEVIFMGPRAGRFLVLLCAQKSTNKTSDLGDFPGHRAGAPNSMPIHAIRTAPFSALPCLCVTAPSRPPRQDAPPGIKIPGLHRGLGFGKMEIISLLFWKISDTARP